MTRPATQKWQQQQYILIVVTIMMTRVRVMTKPVT